MAFEWLIGDAMSQAAMQLNGRQEAEFLSPFSVPVYDCGFKFNQVIIDETKKFVRESLEVSDELHRIVVLTTLNVQLDRTETVSKTTCKLSLIRSDDGKLSALIYIGCSLSEQPAGT